MALKVIYEATQLLHIAKWETEEDDHEDVVPSPQVFIGEGGKLVDSKQVFPPDAATGKIGAMVSNRYRIMGHVASGGFGHGWEAVDTGDGAFTRVFVKTIRGMHEEHPGNFRAMARDELNITRMLRKEGITKHRNIVNVLHVTNKDRPEPVAISPPCEDGDTNEPLECVVHPMHYIVYDLCNAGDLENYSIALQQA